MSVFKQTNSLLPQGVVVSASLFSIIVLIFHYLRALQNYKISAFCCWWYDLDITHP